MENTITLPISKKVLIVRSVMSNKEIREARTELNELTALITSVQGKEPTAEQVALLNSKTSRQDDIIAATLLKRVGISQEELDEMPYPDALYAYNKLSEISQTIPKN